MIATTENSRVNKLTAAGDLAELAFIGVFIDADNYLATVYLRCQKYSKKIALQYKIQALTAKKEELTPEQNKELVDMLIEAQNEGNPKTFVIGSVLRPHTLFDVFTFKGHPAHVGGYIDIIFKPMHARHNPLMISFLTALNRYTDPYSCWDNLSYALKQLAADSRDRIRLIKERDESLGTGIYF